MDLNGKFGVSALVRIALHLENEWGMDVLSIGRECFDRKDSCTLSVTGKLLAYYVTLDGGWVFLRAQLLDLGDEPQELLSVGDGEAGWKTVCRLIRALERSGCRSLQRPIEIGESGPDSWVIA
jgi:hypothetical protein